MAVDPNFDDELDVQKKSGEFYATPKIAK